MSPIRTALLGFVFLASLTPPALADAPLKVMLAEQPRSMDPADQSATETRSVLAALYETLVWRDRLGVLQPGLATAWHVSDDGLEWTFDIRPGVHFHDGAPCDAKAAARSLARLIDPKIALAGGGTYRSIVASVRSEGSSVVVTLQHPYADFPSLIAVIQSAIVSPVAVANGTISRHADGTGPFRFVAWHAGEDVQAERNPSYWGAAAPMDAIEWRWSPEPSVQNMALQTGDADVVIPLAPAFARLYTPGQPAAALAHVQGEPGAALFWMALNTRIRPLDDARVRRALGLAIDRRALVAGLLAGFGKPACHVLTPDIAAALPCAPGEDQAQLDAARALLKAAGVAGGFSVAVTVQEPEEPIAEAVQAMWRKIGVRLEIRRQEAGVWVQAAFAAPAQKAREGTGIVLTSWSAPFVADLQLRPLYLSTNAAPAGANLGFYNNPEIDRMIASAAGDSQPDHRRTTLIALQTMLAQDAPLLPLFVRDTLYGVRRGVEGVHAEPDGSIALIGAHLAGPVEGRAGRDEAGSDSAPQQPEGGYKDETDPSETRTSQPGTEKGPVDEATP